MFSTGPPIHVSNTSVAPLCNSLLVNGDWPPNTNIVYYRVTLKDSIMFENFTETFPVTISESVFKNRTKDYMIELIASNPAGNSSVSVLPVKIKNCKLNQKLFLSLLLIDYSISSS